MLKNYLFKLNKNKRTRSPVKWVLLWFLSLASTFEQQTARILMEKGKSNSIIPVFKHSRNPLNYEHRENRCIQIITGKHCLQPANKTSRDGETLWRLNAGAVWGFACSCVRICVCCSSCQAKLWKCANNRGSLVSGVGTAVHFPSRCFLKLTNI